MEPRKQLEHTLELSADRSNVKDVVKATHDVLDTTLPYVAEDDVETLIEQRTNNFIRQVESASTQQSPQYQQKAGRGQLVVQFLEKRRRKGWFVAKADEETAWESWILDITLTTARSEPEAARNRKQMEQQLQHAAFNIVMIANREMGHIPRITTTETNPFPYQILINPKNDGWGQKIGIL